MLLLLRVVRVMRGGEGGGGRGSSEAVWERTVWGGKTTGIGSLLLGVVAVAVVVSTRGVVEVSIEGL